MATHLTTALPCVCVSERRLVPAPIYIQTEVNILPNNLISDIMCVNNKGREENSDERENECKMKEKEEKGLI